MIGETLKERFFGYEEVSDFKLTRKLPVIITLNGRGFRKTTATLDKPYCKNFMTVLGQTLIRLAAEIEGTTFLYSFNDEIHLVCRNDKTLSTDAWYDNNIQKIITASSAIASIAFFKAAQINNLKLLGDPVFIGKTFTLPSWTETINYFIAKQNQASHTAISMACFYELLKIYNSSDKVLKLIKDLTIDEKYELLMKECDIDLQSYPLSYWRGIACYRTPKLVGDEMKNKLIINDELPFFSKEQEFLSDIFKKY